MSDVPDFVVVGAPKCGTNTLYEVLSAHEEIFLPRKDIDFFGSDLQFTGRRLSKAAYLELFHPANGRLTGDISVWYLLSERAASEIASFAPNSRIVIMLRHPVDLMFSMHGQARYNADESEPSFNVALALEAEREWGRHLPKAPYARHAVFYRKIARLSVQIERYLANFPRQRIHFVLLDDLRFDAQGTMDSLCDFLHVSRMTLDHMPHANPYSAVRSRWVSSVATFVPRRVVPALGLSRLPQPIKRVSIAAYELVRRANTSYSSRPEMDPGLRRQLVREFIPEVERLEVLTQRDLSPWKVLDS